jgi:hypothetical protein
MPAWISSSELHVSLAGAGSGQGAGAGAGDGQGIGGAGRSRGDGEVVAWHCWPANLSIANRRVLSNNMLTTITIIIITTKKATTDFLPIGRKPADCRRGDGGCCQFTAIAQRKLLVLFISLAI